MSSDSVLEIQVDTKSLKKESSVMHLLPCNIEFDGTAPVSSYFQISEGKREQMIAHFRGRELVGRKLKLPDGVIGLNAVQDTRKQSDNINWEITGNFDEVNVWQHDIAMDLTQINESLEWFELAESVSVLFLSLFLYFGLQVVFHTDSLNMS
jgi:hypothetical protein